jgi:hypothetical protein
LAKPEPRGLLSDSRLNLAQTQRARIVAIDDLWQRDKSRLEQAMSRFLPRQGRVDEIQSTLADYSQLSREYDATRAHYWAAAIAILNESQRREVAR